MERDQVSITALSIAYTRGYHAMYDELKIFNDFLAWKLFKENELEIMAQHYAKFIESFDPERALTCPNEATALAWSIHAVGGPPLARARYTEDGLKKAVKQGVQQYVILGAGLDTFAYRHPDMLNNLQVFEVDHPATQDFKRRRLSEAGWDKPEHLHFVPIDFTTGGLSEKLKDFGYDPRVLSFFSWLGVTHYLSREDVFNTLHSIAGTAPVGSTIIFDHLNTDALIPERTSRRLRLISENARRAGEPVKTGFEPDRLAADLTGLGLRLHEYLKPSDIQERYFQGRTDGYCACEHTYIANAVSAKI